MGLSGFDGGKMVGGAVEAAMIGDTFTQNYHVHAFATVNATMRLVKEGKKSFYTQYLLNTSMKLSDAYFVLLMLIVICSVRFVFAGAHHDKARNIPSIFKACFEKYCKKKKESKMSENLWYSCWHTFSFCFGLFVLYSEALTPEHPGWTRLLFTQLDVNWFWFPTLAEIKFLNSPGWPFFPVSTIIQTYYLTELAFWLSCIVFLWIETYRSDFNALLLHHVATCLLIAVSYVCSFWRIGSVVLVTHDLADIFLYGAKTIHYTVTPSIIVDLLFFLFVIGFIVSRLIFFPFFCLLPTLIVTQRNKHVLGVPMSNWHVPGGIALPGFLCVLQVLHIFWFGLIIKMILRASRGNTVTDSGDIRSDVDELEDLPILEGEEEESESNDQRMQLSSLPGVRPTEDMRQRFGIKKNVACANTRTALENKEDWQQQHKDSSSSISPKSRKRSRLPN